MRLEKGQMRGEKGRGKVQEFLTTFLRNDPAATDRSLGRGGLFTAHETRIFCVLCMVIISGDEEKTVTVIAPSLKRPVSL